MKKWIALGLAIAAALLLLFLPNEPKKQYMHNQGTIFGTYYNIRYESSEDLHEAIKQRLQEFDYSLSMFNPQSVISKVNGNDSVVTDSLFEAMYHEAYAISMLSNGAFDITVAPLVNAWGFGTNGRWGDEAMRREGDEAMRREGDEEMRRKGDEAIRRKGDEEIRRKGDEEMIDSIKAFVGYEHIRLVGHHIEKDDERITLDASAIAKGFACDVVAALLRENGCQNLLVDIGGEVVLQGVNDKGNPWRVGITRPTIDAMGAEKELQEIIESSKLCMATSGNYLQYYYVDGQRRSHTIDPRSGYPVEHTLLSATVVANSCMRADALATACMVLGEKEALAMIEKTEDAACYLIVADSDTLRITTSQRWQF